MPAKRVDIPGIGLVSFYKRRDARALKITMGHGNELRVTLPSWMPYRAGLEFVKTKKTWVDQHRRPLAQLETGMLIGKAHRLYLLPRSVTTVSSRVSAQAIHISYPNAQLPSSPDIQSAAKRASIRALRQEATNLLPIRLKQLATQHGFTYHSVTIKQLKARWGSCSAQKDIALNLFLMQLTWPLIDYVLLHELTHTQVLSHNADFWATLESCQPEAKQLRKELRAFQPNF